MSSAKASSSSNSYYPNRYTDFFLMVFVLLFDEVLTFFQLDLPVALSSLTCTFVHARPCASLEPSDLCKYWEDKRKAAAW